MTDCPACCHTLASAVRVCPDCDFDLAPGPNLTFATQLRRLVSLWPSPPQNLVIDPPKADHPVVAWLDVCDAATSLITVGAHFGGNSVRCDRVHNQLFFLPETPTALNREHRGSPEELAQVAAEWMAWIVGLPFEREEWRGRGSVETTRWVIREPYIALVQSRHQPPSTDAPTSVTPVAVAY